MQPRVTKEQGRTEYLKLRTQVLADQNLASGGVQREGTDTNPISLYLSDNPYCSPEREALLYYPILQKGKANLRFVK